MPPTMQPMLKARTKQSRKTKCFEVVNVGPLRLYFSHFELIAFESDKTKFVVCAPIGSSNVATSAGREEHRLILEPDKSNWVSGPEFSRKWTKVADTYFK